MPSIKSKARSGQPKLNRTELARLRTRDLQRLLPGQGLEVGSHDIIEDTPERVCLMEAVAWVSGESHSDHPRCACPILTEIGIEINDTLIDDADRNRLIPAIPSLVGSRTGSKRAYFKRCKLVAERLISQLVSEWKLRTYKPTNGNVLTGFSTKYLCAIADSGLTHKLLRAAIDCLKHLEQAEQEFVGSDMENTVRLLENLNEVWDSEGIRLAQYRHVLGDTSFVQILDPERLPEFLIELATTNA